MNRLVTNDDMLACLIKYLIIKELRHHKSNFKPKICLQTEKIKFEIVLETRNSLS